MKVTVIGAGNMGAGFVKQLTLAGHQVIVTARNLDKAVAVAAENSGATAVAADQAAIDTDVIVLATGYEDAVEALRSVGNIENKIVIDITNPLTADFMGLTIGHNTSAAEEIAKSVSNVRIVKAFNTVFAQVLSEGANSINEDKVSVFIAGDDSQAKQVVADLATSMEFETVDAGALKNARYLEPLAGLNIYLGYGAGLGTAIAPTWARKS